MTEVTKNNKQKRNNLLMVFIWLLAIACSIVFGNIRHEKNFRAFNEKELKGIISYNYNSSGGNKISLNNEEEKHHVYAKYNKGLKTHMYRFIEIGDSLYKAKNDDYIHIFKGEQEYLFEIPK